MRFVGPTLLVLLGLACASACGDSKRSESPEAVDSGVELSCAVGTLNCRCNVAAACVGDLLCVAGRCIQTEGTSGIDKPPVFPPNNIVRIRDASVPPPDASELVPDAAAPPPDDAGDAANDASSDAGS